MAGRGPTVGRGARAAAAALLARAAALLACAAAGGCAGGGFYEHELALAREGRAALASMADVEAARVATLARLERLEALARALPDEPRLRRLLLEGWAEYALLFVEDELEEAAERGDEAGARYHALRARNAYARALYHGDALFEGGGRARGGDGDAPALLWWGASRLRRERLPASGRARSADAGAASEAVAALERSAALAPSEAGGLGEALLGEWYAEGPARDPARAEAHFARARRAAAGRALLPELLSVRSQLCAARDAERWDAALRAVLEAPDPAPELRLQNAAAKRRAARDLGGTRRARCLAGGR
ncbi:MAG TPA: TRAP transporter TatT component family protein [Polyangiaceae bacterium]|nr:TRAP transporter TatT component family protein [Polyangiaceae bacterium]